MKRFIPLALLSLLVIAPNQVIADQGKTPIEWRERVSSIDNGTYSDSDIEEEMSFGREIAARILGQHKLNRSKSLQRYVSRVGKVLAKNSSRPELDFHFAVIQSEAVNAYSTPGGYVFVTSAALKNMKNEAELAGVLSHEIAHVCERHIVRDLSIKGRETSGLSSLAALIGGAGDAARVAFAQAVDKAVDILFKDGYKRDDEKKADEDAVYFTFMAGYDPQALETFLSRVAESKPKVGKSYPQYDERLSLIQKTASENGKPVQPLKLGAERFAVETKGLL